MKIYFQKNNQFYTITYSRHGINGSKSFRDPLLVLNYAQGLDDEYIMSIHKDLLNFAREIDHEILRCKKIHF